ncbi:hypothetical protein FB451DRAFT_1070863 [Mycena latifolia]|nr:hypothetical protein FB451DRAFT_1070863 [Mycena latifolia]
MAEVFLWSSPDGFTLARRILEPTPVPYVPHDHQLEGVCKSLDGIDLFAITPTGSGKTSYDILYITIILEIRKNPALCPSADFPENPCLLIICPTTPLQIEMAENMKSLGLNALAINSETRNAALRENKDLWFLARTEPSVVLTGPEQLKTAEFEKTLRDKTFYDRVCGTGFDEVHLLNTWGTSFRKDFLQMGFVKHRLTEHRNPWILTSATVRAGSPFDNICNLLGLKTGNFHLIRRSCARPDVQIIFRELVSPIGDDSFPEFNWILTENRPTVMFPKTISLGSRIYAYLLRKLNADNTSTHIRMYNSLNFDSHNAETRELLKGKPDDPDYCQIIIGTDSLSVGVGMPARLDAIIVGDVDDTDDGIQKFGRVGRTLVKNATQSARGIVYAPLRRARPPRRLLQMPPLAGQKPPDLSFPRMIVAPCKVTIQDELYDNPTIDPPCTCLPCSRTPATSARATCNCSGCLPETSSTTTKAPPASRVNTQISKAKRLTKLHRAHGQQRLLELRLEIWKASDQSKFWMLPPSSSFLTPSSPPFWTTSPCSTHSRRFQNFSTVIDTSNHILTGCTRYSRSSYHSSPQSVPLGRPKMRPISRPNVLLKLGRLKEAPTKRWRMSLWATQIPQMVSGIF